MFSTVKVAGCICVTKYARGPKEFVSDQYNAFSNGLPLTSKLESKKEEERKDKPL